MWCWWAMILELSRWGRAVRPSWSRPWTSTMPATWWLRHWQCRQSTLVSPSVVDFGREPNWFDVGSRRIESRVWKICKLCFPAKCQLNEADVATCSSCSISCFAHRLKTMCFSLLFPELNPSGNGGFVQTCERFIYQHAEECAATEGWLELPKSALVNIIQSDDVSTE